MINRFHTMTAFVLLICGCAIGPAIAQPARMTLPIDHSWTDDLDSLLKRRFIRLLVPYSKTLYFTDRGRQMGVTAEFARRLEETLNAKQKKGPYRMQVVLVPTPRDRLFDALKAGKGDVIAADLTITPARQKEVDFVEPMASGVKEIVVTGPTAPPLKAVEDLSGREVHVHTASSYATHLNELNERLRSAGKAEVKIVAADPVLESEDLLEMVSAGILPFAVTDAYKAELWAQIFPKLTPRRDLAINAGGEIAWAVRKDNPQLRQMLSEFMRENKVGTSFGSTVRRRYFADAKVMREAYATDDVKRFDKLVSLFRQYGDRYGFDWLLLAAQGYQESQLDQTRRSPRGAVGIMQLLPSTAAAKPIGIKGIAQDPERNIQAGAAYLRHLAETYIAEPEPDPMNRALFAFAAYNAGPGNLRKFREAAAGMGLDRNVWFNNVEQGAAKVVGRETVQYVGNIYKYFVAYKLLNAKQRDLSSRQ